jgi:chorismate-pyruvate lyase
MVLSGAASLAALSAQAAWPDTPAARLQIRTELQTLNADLLSHDSATLTLDRWCTRHKLADPPEIVADRIAGKDKRPPDDVRARLRLGADQTVAYRRVRLRCGERVLSEADNWYVPSRLTADMNRVLTTTDTPFGRVIRPLGFRRETISAKLLWSPLPGRRDIASAPVRKRAADTHLSIPDKLIEHRALLTSANGEPLCYVVETYTKAVLDFPPPAVGKAGHPPIESRMVPWVEANDANAATSRGPSLFAPEPHLRGRRRSLAT